MAMSHDAGAHQHRFLASSISDLLAGLSECFSVPYPEQRQLRSATLPLLPIRPLRKQDKIHTERGGPRSALPEDDQQTETLHGKLPTCGAGQLEWIPHSQDPIFELRHK